MKLKKHPFRNINFKILSAALTLLLANTLYVFPASGTADLSVTRESTLACTDFKFVFARGSGIEVGSERDFQPFKSAVDEVFGGSGYSYSFYELGSLEGGWSGYSYPAPGIGISSWSRFETSLGALLSGGEYHAYGESVDAGSYEAMTYIFMLHGSCPSTKIVLAGYSQGAQVVSATLRLIEPSWIFSALTFGDPKLYLPEGQMNLFTRTTPACRDGQKSDYRAYVPDCYAYQGILGGFNPYQPDSAYSGKLKAYCQFHDVICSASIDLDNLVYGHASYDEQGTYKRAIQDVYNMIVPETYARPAQDLAILFDVTDSMGSMLDQFKSEAIRAAKKVLRQGGRVALYTYGDLFEGEETQEICNFETCSSDNIETYIRGLTIDGGGDLPESLLSASYTLMRRLNWRVGANKSVLALTDADYHNPDFDGITLGDVVELSASIDPVHFYLLVHPAMEGVYNELAYLTDGGVYFSDVEDVFATVENTILSRPAEEFYTSSTMPAYSAGTVSNLILIKLSDSSVRASFDSDGVLNFITLNDYFAGYTAETSIGITDLDLSESISICVSSASAAGYRGDPVCASTEDLTLTTGRGALTTSTTSDSSAETSTSAEATLPKAPNTGRR